MAVSHIKNLAGADWTGTVTIHNSQGSTVTANATGMVRPTDWNSAHNQYLTIAGNTAGTSGVSGTNIVWAGGNNVTLSANGSTVSVIGATPGIAQTLADSLYAPKVNTTEPNGIVDAANASMTWNDGTRTIQITTGSNYTVWSNATKTVISTTKSVTIANTTGIHYVYFDDAGNLVETTTFSTDLILKWAIVAIIYWNATDGVAVPDAQYEMHGAEWPAALHLQQHLTVGCVYDSGLALTAQVDQDGSAAAHIGIVADTGYIWDEDIRHSIPARAVTDNIAVMYRSGSAGDWTVSKTSSAVVRNAGTGRAAYNQYTGATWQLTEMTEGYFSVAYVYAYPSITDKWLVVMCQTEHATLEEAQVVAQAQPDLGAMPLYEFRLVGSLVFETSSSYTNAAKARLRHVDSAGLADWVDWRNVRTANGITLSYPGIALQVGGEVFNAGTVTLGNANGLSFVTSNGSVVGSYTVPTQTAYVFSNSNGVSWGTNGSTVTATVKTDYLTTAAQSDHSHGNPTLALTNLSGTTASNSAGLTLSLSAAAPGAGGGAAISAGANSQNTGTVNFANSNGITFGLSNNGTLTASHNGLTTARASNDAIGLNTALTANGVAWTVNSGGLSLNVPAFLTTAAHSTHSHGNPTLALTNLTGTTASASNGFTLSLSAAAAGGGGAVSVYGSNNTTQTSSGSFSDALYVSGAGILSAGMTGNTMILSVPAGGGAGDGYNIIQGSGNTAGTMNTYASATFVLAGGPSITLSQSSNTMSINAPATSQLTYAGAVSLASAGSTITISGIPPVPTLNLTNLSGTTATATNGAFTLSLSAAAPGGGAGATFNVWRPYDEAVRVAGQVGQGSLAFFAHKGHNVTFDRVVMPVNYTNASNSSFSFTASFWVGIYTSNASTLSLVASTSASYATTNSGTAGNMSLWLGPRLVTIPWSTSLPEDYYWIGVLSRTTTGGGAGMSMSQFVMSQLNSSMSGILGAGSSTNAAFFPGVGHYSATTNALPGAISFTQIRGGSSAFQRPPIVAFVNGSV